MRRDVGAGRCVILSCNGQRTMRTCLDTAERLSVDDISESDFEGAKWVFLSGYILYRYAVIAVDPLEPIEASFSAPCAINTGRCHDVGTTNTRLFSMGTFSGSVAMLTVQTDSVTMQLQAGSAGESGGAGGRCGCKGGAGPGVL